MNLFVARQESPPNRKDKKGRQEVPVPSHQYAPHKCLSKIQVTTRNCEMRGCVYLSTKSKMAFIQCAHRDGMKRKVECFASYDNAIMGPPEPYLNSKDGKKQGSVSDWARKTTQHMSNQLLSECHLPSSRLPSAIQ